MDCQMLERDSCSENKMTEKTCTYMPFGSFQLLFIQGNSFFGLINKYPIFTVHASFPDHKLFITFRI